jgi:hypothetical protein
MSVEKAKQKLLKRFAAADGALFVAVFLELPTRWALADTGDPHGRAVRLIGRAWVDQDEAGHAATTWVLAQVHEGRCPDLVVPITLAPAASQAFVQIVEDGPVNDVLLHGPRWSGKSIDAFVAVLGLAEGHVRAQAESPFKTMLLHDSLKSAEGKSGQTLELPLWQGIWSLESDRTRAVCRLGGRALVQIEFVGCQDPISRERLRQSTHCVVAEEVIGSLDDGVGIEEDHYLLARSSMLRLETPRRVSVAVTNPGALTLWPARYWGLVGTPLPNRLAIQIPREDRLTVEQQALLEDSFANNPILQRRLSRGEWVGVVHGATVAEGFDEHVHVSTTELTPRPQFYLAIGWDGGHSPSAVMGQNVGGQVRVYAALNDLRVGVLELIERQVLPWLQTCAPWALANYGAKLIHVIDPNMSTPGQATIMESAEKMILAKLGGQVVKGPVRWPPRREAILKVLAPRHVGGRAPLQISLGPDTRLLVEALSGQWFYSTLPSGQVDRSGPKKPNSPHADIGDAAAYLFGWLVGGEVMDVTPREIKVETEFSLETVPGRRDWL